MIVSDLLKNDCFAGVMLYKSWELALICFAILPFYCMPRACSNVPWKCLEEVRNRVANLNTFVQERISGMKIVQLFTREDEEYRRSKNQWSIIKGFDQDGLVQLHFFSNCRNVRFRSLGVDWLRPPRGFRWIAANGDITLGVITAFIQLSQMLFRPLRMIADKFIPCKWEWWQPIGSLVFWHQVAHRR